MIHVLQCIGLWLGYALVLVLCVSGIFLSCLSISGTWFVAVATIISALLRDAPFPGIWTIVFFLAIAIAVEVLEAVAGYVGVKKRGGSRLAGAGAVAGGILGTIVGAFIPPPIIGSLLGMLAGSFAVAYLIERRRVLGERSAAHVATGAVLARIAVLMVKIVATMGMVGYLLIGMALNAG